VNIIDRIIALLAEKGVSAAQMSRDLGFSNAVFSYWKKRKQKPSTDKLVAMAEYFGVSLDYLVGRESEDKHFRVGVTPETKKEKNKVKTFEFRNYTLDLNIAGNPFTVNCVAELIEAVQAHQGALAQLATQISDGTKTSADAITLCKEILADILGESAFDRIFADREPTLTDVSDVLRFVIGQITERIRQGQQGE